MKTQPAWPYGKSTRCPFCFAPAAAGHACPSDPKKRGSLQ